MVLIVALGAGWAYYHFSPDYHLPQNRTLLDVQGHEINARIEACNTDVLQYIAPEDGSTRYVAISTLTAADQEFARHLSQTLRFDYPFECTLGPGGFKPDLVQVEGHDADWVKLTIQSDHSTHYVPFTAFSTSDQVLIQQLPATLTAQMPISYAVKNAQGQALGQSILGHNDNAVKLGLADGTSRYVYLNDLSALDQKLVRLTAPNLNLRAPMECVMADKTGKKLFLRIEGRSANTVKYTLITDGLTYYAPLADFSEMDQKVLRLLPSNMTFNFPFEYSLTGSDGKPMRVRLEGRTPNIIKFTSMSDGRIYYQLISTFSDADIKFLQMLPATMRIEFPLDYTLMSKTGQALQAHLLGRSNNQVKFTLADNKIYNYQIANLADESAALLQLIPANLVEADMADDAPPPVVIVQAAVPTLPSAMPSARDKLPEMHTELADLVKTGLNQQSVLDSMPITSRTIPVAGQSSAFNQDRVSYLSQLDSTQSQIIKLCKGINTILVSEPKPGASTTVQAQWAQVVLDIKHYDKLQGDLNSTVPTTRDPTMAQIRDTGKQIITLLNKINSESGNYSP